MKRIVFGAASPQLPFLDKIYEAVAKAWSSTGSIACKVKQTADFYQLMFFPAVREISGGCEDGKEIFLGFNLNIGKFAHFFDEGPNVTFDCARKDFINNVRFRGKVDGNKVEIAFLPNPPPNQKALERIYANGPKKGTVEAIIGD